MTAGPKRLAAQEVVFQPTGLRDLEGDPRFTVLQVTAGPKRPAAKEVVFQSTGLRDLEGVPSLAVSRRGTVRT